MAEIINPPPHPKNTHTLLILLLLSLPLLLPSLLSCCVLTKKVRDCSVLLRQTQAVWTFSRRQTRLYLQSDFTLNAHTHTETHAHAAVTWSVMTLRRPHLGIVCFTLTMFCWPSFITAVVSLRGCSLRTTDCFSEEVTKSDR